jgi:hypothetical protein
MESGVRYDYSDCNDPVYFELKALLEESKAWLKCLLSPVQNCD